MYIEELIADVEPRLAEIEKEMSKPEVASDASRMTELARKHRRFRELLTVKEQICNIRTEIDDLREALDDPELSEIAVEELPALEEKLTNTEQIIRRLLVPEDPEDSRNAVLELRAGTGGEEAALFASDLYKMYQRYFERCGWKQQVLSAHFSDLGGVKEIIVSITGDGAYGRIKYESGVHRVQRVPITETSGRIHTSAATVAILPEAKDVDVHIDPSEIRTETYRSSGPGGQHVNKTDSAVRITHIPTSIVVSCQDEKSQLKNKNQALKVLRSRLFKRALDEQHSRRAAQRRSLVSSGDRSDKIRTYNFPQNRVTDHRAQITIHQLEEILSGELDQLIDPILEFFASQKLSDVIQSKTRE